MSGAVRAFIDRVTRRPIVPVRSDPAYQAIVHGPTYRRPSNGELHNLGNTSSLLPIFPLVPDTHIVNEFRLAPAAVQDLLLSPVGGMWLVKVQITYGINLGRRISIGTNQNDFGLVSQVSPTNGVLRGPTIALWDAELFPEPIDFLPGGVFIPQGETAQWRCENDAGQGDNESFYIFSFATRRSQVAPFLIQPT